MSADTFLSEKQAHRPCSKYRPARVAQAQRPSLPSWHHWEASPATGFFSASLANATRGQRGGTPNNNSSRKRKISLTGSRALLSGVPTLSAVSVRPGCSRTQTVQNRPPALVYSTENRRPGCLPRSVRVTSIGQIPVRIVAWTSYARKRTLGHHLMRPDGRPW